MDPRFNWGEAEKSRAREERVYIERIMRHARAELLFNRSIAGEEAKKAWANRLKNMQKRTTDSTPVEVCEIGVSTKSKGKSMGKRTT